MFSSNEKQALKENENTLEQNGRPFELRDALFCTTHGSIYAISKSDGSRFWQAKFPAHSFLALISIFVTDNAKVIVGCNGRTACLDAYTGQVKWVNHMAGTGIEETGVVCTMSGPLRPPPTPMADSSEDPPSYDGATAVEKPLTIGSTRGEIVAVDPETGDEMWRYNCPGGGYQITTVVVEPPRHGPNRWPFQVVYVGCNRWVYCLRASTGDLLWSNKICENMIGLGMMCMATPWSSRVSAELYTDFSSIPHSQDHELERRRHNINGLA
ncbi:hypothetical protein DM01DRAFT_1329790 [Hesseltinella vesiculosa]|uniref:Pyrrolo-quinoline quinone repeat domain-containing protein n=1 Tax=Hesseltinella vesiculosa TaxID=101127 RepID=A0A1X2G2X0_9FUNG|nr:hypothetical protein DM01DRAFT_1329790 [Hesseltinella vesiculosa]